MPFPVVPEHITVHLGPPDQAAENVTVPFTDYIKNVASSEIYPTWPENALRANILAQISVALNRIYTEYYRGRGYDFDITSSTRYDQAYVPGRSTFENIDRLVDDSFNDYIVRQGNVEPLYARFCDGVRTQCPGLSQWGSVELAEQGLTPYEILQRYFGDNINIVFNAPVGDGTPSYPGRPLTRGSVGEDVRTIQQQLERIRRNYPAIPRITEISNVFDQETEDAVRAFQRIFNLEEDGIVGKATWYKIKMIYNGVKSLSEITSEGLTIPEAQRVYPEALRLGDTGLNVETVRFYLAFLGYFLPQVPPIPITDTFDEAMLDAVYAFQRDYGLVPTGVIDEATWNKIVNAYYYVLANAEVSEPYPGEPLSRGSQGASVLFIQTALNAVSQHVPEIPSVADDGIFGPETERAVRAFQSYYGLTVDGIVGPETWRLLALEMGTSRDIDEPAKG